MQLRIIHLEPVTLYSKVNPHEEAFSKTCSYAQGIQGLLSIIASCLMKVNSSSSYALITLGSYPLLKRLII